MKLLLAIGGAVAAAGVFLLATASAETALLATHYPLLLLLNATLAALLAGLVVYQLVVLARRYRCTACGAVLVVVPRGVGRSLRYTLEAIAYALSLWGYARPAHGRTTVSIYVRGKRYRRIRTDSRGYFRRTVPYVRGRTYRLKWSNRLGPPTRVYPRP